MENDFTNFTPLQLEEISKFRPCLSFDAIKEISLFTDVDKLIKNGITFGRCVNALNGVLFFMQINGHDSLWDKFTEKDKENNKSSKINNFKIQKHNDFDTGRIVSILLFKSAQEIRDIDQILKQYFQPSLGQASIFKNNTSSWICSFADSVSKKLGFS